MSITNLGNQYITFDYKHPATAKDFNTLLKGAIKPGIYSGGDITITGANTISVAPFIAYLYSGTDKLVRVETRTAVALTIAESTPVLSITLPWANVVENWLDWNQRAHGSAVITNEVCLGEMVFVANAINSIDYTLKTWGKQLESDVIDGIAPLNITSTTKVTNLNADMLDAAHKSIDGTLATNSDLLIPTEKAIKTYISNNQLSNNEDKKGCQVYTAKTVGASSVTDTGILTCGTGSIQVAKNIIDIISPQTITIGTLTASRWHIVYINTLGVLSVEETTDSTYTTFPYSTLNTAAPIEAKGSARYKSGDNTMRAIAVAFSASTSTFKPKIYNLPFETFGTGELGDVSLDGTGLGATGTPLFGIEEDTATTPVEYFEYNFSNLTLTGTCYCGNVNGAALAPVIIRVKGTLIIESGGQLNGDARGANGGAGGVGGTKYQLGGVASDGGAGGAGAKSGRPIYVFANRIINKKTSGYWITTIAGNASNGVASSNCAAPGGGGGGGAGSSSSLIVITNSAIDKKYVNEIMTGLPGHGGVDIAVKESGGCGAPFVKERFFRKIPLFYQGGFPYINAVSWSANGADKTVGTFSGTRTPGFGGQSAGEKYCASGGVGGTVFVGSDSNSSTFNLTGGNGGGGYYGGGGGGGVANSGNTTTGDTMNATAGNGGAGSSERGGGGGGGGGGCIVASNGSATGVATAGQDGSAPVVSHEGLGFIEIIENYSTRYGI